MNGTSRRTKVKISVATRLFFVIASSLFLCGLLLIPRGHAENAAADDSLQPSTTQHDQAALSITVYNSSLALVRDVREITIPTGMSQLKFMDIAASVNPATVHFRSLDDPGRLSV